MSVLLFIDYSRTTSQQGIWDAWSFTQDGREARLGSKEIRTGQPVHDPSEDSSCSPSIWTHNLFSDELPTATQDQLP